jgi:hypothetical protein
MLVVVPLVSGKICKCSHLCTPLTVVMSSDVTSLIIKGLLVTLLPVSFMSYLLFLL